MGSRTFSAVAALSLSLLLVASSDAADRAATSGSRPSAESSEGVPVRTPVPLNAPTSPAAPPYAQPQAPAAAGFGIDWYSINGGGVIGATSTNWTLDATVGQAVAGTGTSPSYQLEVGFWYGAAATACPIALTGDVTLDGEIKTSDIIYLVNYVLKAGADPLPCAASGDVNCDGQVKTSDIIYLVNYVLKAGAAPCDVCSIIPGTWSCP